jgi:predicted NAD/FAD-binding protein
VRIAVVGSGIAGLGSAWLLSQQHEVTLFEANDYLGGHTHTHRVTVGGEEHAVDTGFIVHNPQHYPLLTRLFEQLGVRSQDTTMSFSVRNERTGLEYGASSLSALFCQRRNLLSPRFHRMLRDIARFYREAPRLLEDAGQAPALGSYLEANRYGAAFIEDHLVPMAAALWSAAPARVLDFPAAFLVRFMVNHNMMTLGARPPWRVVCGGSDSYVRALQRRWRVLARTQCPVHAIRRDAGAVTVSSAAGSERYDHVVLACHSDQALQLLTDCSDTERSVLGAIGYQVNDVVLHTDAADLPRSRLAWSAWNALVPRDPQLAATVSYSMNLLQGLVSSEPLVVTLNPCREIPEERVLRRLRYSHPVFTTQATEAQQRKPEIQGQRRTWFAGAYWGYGFHEDGLRSAVEVAAGLGAAWEGPGVRQRPVQVADSALA